MSTNEHYALSILCCQVVVCRRDSFTANFPLETDGFNFKLEPMNRTRDRHYVTYYELDIGFVSLSIHAVWIHFICFYVM